MKVKVFIATSLDGFIAKKDGDISWLISATDSTDDHGYSAFMSGIDLILMGRATFEKVLSFGIEWPYPVKTVVLSHQLRSADLAPELQDKVEIRQGAMVDILHQLKQQGYKAVYLDGGTIIQQGLRHQLVDELTLTRIPVLIGEGIPLFGALAADLKLQHLETRVYQSGFVQSRYSCK
jgi:dihydrofolate reductase